MNTIVGIVILNYKTYKETIRLTRHLLNFSIKNSFRIVIVDNQSPNNSYKLLEDEFGNIENVNVIQTNENGGYAIGNNVGLRFLDKYKPEYVIILNNDIYFNEHVITKCISEYEKIPNAGAVSPVQYLPNGQIAPIKSLRCNTFLKDLLNYSLIYLKFRKNHVYKSNTKFDNIQQTDIIPGCFIFISYERFKEIGFFYEGTFLFCEERFLYKRLTDRGYRNYTIIDQFYIHDHSHTINKEVDNFSQMKLLNEGYIKYTKMYRKNPVFKIFLLRIGLKQQIYKLKLINKLRHIKNNHNK